MREGEPAGQKKGNGATTIIRLKKTSATGKWGIHSTSSGGGQLWGSGGVGEYKRGEESEQKAAWGRRDHANGAVRAQKEQKAGLARGSSFW